MRLLTSRGKMRELTVRALVHGAALGNQGDAQAAALLAPDIDNAALAALIELTANRHAAPGMPELRS